MVSERSRCNGSCYGSDPFVDLDRPRLREKSRSRPMSSSSSSSVDSISENGNCGSGGSVGGANYIEHRVSKMDTLAGVAIKYGVEVADIKRMNGLVTDLQMFALKTLQIPLPGRHPPSPIQTNGPATTGESSIDQTPCRKARFDVLESLQSLGFETPKRNVSPAMSSLQGYYRLKPKKHPEEGTEMGVYSAGRSHYLEDGPFLKPSSRSEPPPNRHRNSRSLVNGGVPSENGELVEDVPVAEVEECEAEKLNRSVRRRQKAETDTNTPLKEDNGGGSFFTSLGKGLGLMRPKSTNRIAIAADADAGWLNPVMVGLGESLATSFFDGVRKSASTTNLKEQENNNGLSIWNTSKWSLKPDLQAFSAASLTRPIFDGLPKSGRRSKAALD